MILSIVCNSLLLCQCGVGYSLEYLGLRLGVHGGGFVVLMIFIIGIDSYSGLASNIGMGNGLVFGSNPLRPVVWDDWSLCCRLLQYRYDMQHSIQPLHYTNHKHCNVHTDVDKTPCSAAH